MPAGLTSPVHLLVITVVAMIVLGPEKLPHAMRQAGKFVADVRRWSSVVAVDLQDVLSLDPNLSSPSPAVTPTPTNGDSTEPSKTSSDAAVAAPSSASVPSALSPGGEWADSAPAAGVTGSRSGEPSPVPTALREGGEWSDPR